MENIENKEPSKGVNSNKKRSRYFWALGVVVLAIGMIYNNFNSTGLLETIGGIMGVSILTWFISLVVFTIAEFSYKDLDKGTWSQIFFGLSIVISIWVLRGGIN